MAQTTRCVHIIVVLRMKIQRPDNCSLCTCRGEYRTNITSTINLPVCSHNSFGANLCFPVILTQYQWVLCFLHLCGTWGRDEKLMSSDTQIATMMAKRKTQESEKAPQKLVFTLPQLSHICVCMQDLLYQTVTFVSVCFLRIKVVFLHRLGWIWVDKVSDPVRRTGIRETWIYDFVTGQSGERSLMWLKLAPESLCIETHTSSGLHSVCRCTVAPCCLVLFQAGLLDFYAYCCLTFVVLLCYDSNVPLLLCFLTSLITIPFLSWKGFGLCEAFSVRT